MAGTIKLISGQTETMYETIQAANADAQSGDIISLTENYTATVDDSIKDGVTFNPNGFDLNITGNSAFSAAFSGSEGGTVNLSGTVYSGKITDTTKVTAYKLTGTNTVSGSIDITGFNASSYAIEVGATETATNTTVTGTLKTADGFWVGNDNVIMAGSKDQSTHKLTVSGINAIAGCTSNAFYAAQSSYILVSNGATLYGADSSMHGFFDITGTDSKGDFGYIRLNGETGKRAQLTVSNKAKLDITWNFNIGHESGGNRFADVSIDSATLSTESINIDSATTKSDSGSTLKLTNSKVSSSELNNYGFITLDAKSMITLTASGEKSGVYNKDGAAGCITVDMTGASEYGVYKLIDAADTETSNYGIAGINFKFADGKDNDYTLSVKDNDLYAIRVDMSSLAVNAAWSDKKYGDEVTVGEGTSAKAYYYGITAYSQMADAIRVVTASNLPVSIAVAGNGNVGVTETVTGEGTKFTVAGTYNVSGTEWANLGYLQLNPDKTAGLATRYVLNIGAEDAGANLVVTKPQLCASSDLNITDSHVDFTTQSDFSKGYLFAFKDSTVTVKNSVVGYDHSQGNSSTVTAGQASTGGKNGMMSVYLTGVFSADTSTVFTMTNDSQTDAFSVYDRGLATFKDSVLYSSWIAIGKYETNRPDRDTVGRDDEIATLSLDNSKVYSNTADASGLTVGDAKAGKLVMKNGSVIDYTGINATINTNGTVEIANSSLKAASITNNGAFTVTGTSKLSAATYTGNLTVGSTAAATTLTTDGLAVKGTTYITDGSSVTLSGEGFVSETTSIKDSKEEKNSYTDNVLNHVGYTLILDNADNFNAHDIYVNGGSVFTLKNGTTGAKLFNVDEGDSYLNIYGGTVNVTEGSDLYSVQSYVTGTVNLDSTSTLHVDYLRINKAIAGKQGGTINVNGGTLKSNSLTIGELRGEDAKYYINGTDQTAKLNLTGGKVTATSFVSNGGLITMDYASTITTSAYTTNSGCITVDMTGATEASYKLVDYTGTGTITDYGTVTLTGTGAGNYNTFCVGNDLYAITVGTGSQDIKPAWLTVDGTKANPVTLQYSLDSSFDTYNQVSISKTNVENYLNGLYAGQGTLYYRYGTESSWTKSGSISCGTEPETPKVYRGTGDGNADVFFARTTETFTSGLIARNVGIKGDSSFATSETVSLKGKNSFNDLYLGGKNANILYLTDTENGDALFLDNIYSAFPTDYAAQARLGQISEIRAGDGSDLIDMTSQRYEYVGEDMTIRGGDGDDIIWANKGNNKLFGDAGNDTLYGATGNDVIVGGSGNDTMRGNGGDDIFTFHGDFGNDTVYQCNGGTVTLWFDEGNISKWDEVAMTYTDGDNSVKVSGVTKDDVTLKFGDDSSDQYDVLVSVGAFEDASSTKLFTTKEGQGIIAQL